jgi:8-oxo-dGTP pyrophosphatase MutT (NUDIX family)
MSKKRIPAGAVVRGTDKGYVHGDLKPGSERPVEKFEQTYPYMRPRDAATLILVRRRRQDSRGADGCRAAKSAFMPNRYVFPGGRVDRADAHVPIATPLDRHVKARC